MKKIILLILLISSIQTTKAQNNWSLKKCIEYALENNITIKQQVIQENISKVDYESSKANLLPDLNFSASDNVTFGRSVDPFTNTFTTDRANSLNFGLSSSITVFSGLQNYNSIKQSELNLMATSEYTKKIKNDISLSLSNAYLQVLFAEELLNNSKNQLEITKLQVERTKVLVEAGKLPHGNLPEVQAQYANEELLMINNQNNLRSARLALIQILELDYSEDFRIVRPDFQELDSLYVLPDINTVYNTALALPQIKSAELYLQSAQQSLAIAKGALSPSLTVGANYGTGYSSERKLYDFEGNSMSYPAGDQIKDNQSLTISFRLFIPIFNKFSTAHSIKKSKINILQSENQLEMEKQNLYKDIQTAVNSAISAQAKYWGSKKAVLAMRESFKYAQQKFDLGLVNSLDYNTAKNNLAKADSDLLQAKYEFIFTKTVLDFYLGNPINL